MVRHLMPTTRATALPGKLRLVIGHINLLQCDPINSPAIVSGTCRTAVLILTFTESDLVQWASRERRTVAILIFGLTIGAYTTFAVKQVIVWTGQAAAVGILRIIGLPRYDVAGCVTCLR